MKNKPHFTTSEFPVLISKIIDDFLTAKGITQEELARRCRLHAKTISKLKSGQHVSKQLIIILSLVMHMSVPTTLELLDSAGYTLNNNNNTDRAYLYAVRTHMELENFDTMITTWNNDTKSPYMIDRITPLHRKNKE